GYFRSLSNKSSVLVNGQRCPLLGRVTMDQIVVDVSRVPGVKIGQTAVILGKQKQEEIAADELAGYAGTINYEILCSLGSRLPRVYKS
ncbi:MAG TPA: alanine racemase C-terminal domain-containing protein, partial [Candidatus Omnitrophota bacterium]|nr:alanine racemase C-terminal domain-containing protein [Candidatus Omnitrophota bacterium]